MGLAHAFQLVNKRIHVQCAAETWRLTDENEPGYTAGDNQSMYTGCEWDNQRVAWNPNGSAPPEAFQPAQDAYSAGQNGRERRFGSAHPSAFQMSFCDGSVHSISYDIDSNAHRSLAHRFDGGIAQVEGL